MLGFWLIGAQNTFYPLFCWKTVFRCTGNHGLLRDGVECYFKGFVHPKTYALMTGFSTCILENIKKLTMAFANGQLSSPP